MRITLFTVSFKCIYDDDSEFDTTKAFNILRGITYDILYYKFLEDPEEYLHCALVTDDDRDKKDRMEFFVELDESFYDKHIGKLIKEARSKLVGEIIREFMKKLKEVDWDKYLIRG